MTPIWNNIKRVFRRLTPLYMAETELRAAQLELLESMTTLEHAQAITGYHAARVKRLQAFVKNHGVPNDL